MSYRVLVVDDSLCMRMLLKNMLSKSDFEVVGEAGDGIEALSKYKELKPDIVTLDITMPKRDGISALKDIMSYDSNANCIMCSAMGQQPMVLDSVKAGAKDFIVKPFCADKVIEVFNRVLR